MYFLGIDLGSSSIKLSILDGNTGRSVADCHYPESELAIQSPSPGWAEQDPQIWWDSIVSGLAKIFADSGIQADSIEAIGISYQMHGLVLVDEQQQVLRPAIIWCDSRAVQEGELALNALGADYCFSHLLNSPGNFTAAKLRWVQVNEPDIFRQVDKFMLPGDYVAMKLSGEVTGTAGGLSEGILWDFKDSAPALQLLDHWGISAALVPELRPALGEQCRVSAAVAAELGFRAGIPVTYRAGDQPNNAFSLNVLDDGEVAATAGTSGVIYAVSAGQHADRESRVNSFLHVGSDPMASLQGILLCINGTGRAYSWLRTLLSGSGSQLSYQQLNQLGEDIPVGSEGLVFMPFGNGAERLFQNRQPGAGFSQIDFNRHTPGHMVRAVQEGIIFAMGLGFKSLQSMGMDIHVIRAGRANLFSSDVFARLFANIMQIRLELYETNGAEGAARAAALGSGHYRNRKEAFSGLQHAGLIEPDAGLQEQYQQAFAHWSALLEQTVTGQDS